MNVTLKTLLSDKKMSYDGLASTITIEEGPRNNILGQNSNMI